MDETLDAACLSLLWADDDYAQVQRRARDSLARHGVDLVLALSDLATHLARIAADSENRLRGLAGHAEPVITPQDVIHTAVADRVGDDRVGDDRVDIGGEG